MKERPIIFSGPMVRAILEGRKGQTRRVAGLVNDLVRGHGGTRVTQTKAGWTVSRDAMHTRGIREAFNVTCPYGVPSDRLWVRETHYVESAGYQDGTGKFVLYRATTPDAPCPWTPSIHMPRWASRLTLEIKAVRVERLQEISEEDARAEGVKASDATMMFQAIGEGKVRSVPELQNTARGAYVVLWDSINAKRGYGWDANPWVWVVEFVPLFRKQENGR